MKTVNLILLLGILTLTFNSYSQTEEIYARANFEASNLNHRALEKTSEQTTWRMAPGRSSIEFKVKHLLFLNVEGKFRKFEGKVVTENRDFSIVQIECFIPVNSIYTGNQDRDKHLLEEDFFYLDRFPEISFKSKSILKTGENTYKIEGDLTIRGITIPIQLKGKYGGQKVISSGKTLAEFTAYGSLNRNEFGLTWNTVTEAGGALVGETVEIIINATLIKED